MAQTSVAEIGCALVFLRTQLLQLPWLEMFLLEDWDGLDGLQSASLEEHYVRTCSGGEVSDSDSDLSFPSALPHLQDLQ